MRKLYIFVLVVFLMGCLSGPAKFTIPDEPRFRQLHAYPVEGGICLDNEGIEILQGNIHALKEYTDKMRKVLEGLQKTR